MIKTYHSKLVKYSYSNDIISLTRPFQDEKEDVFGQMMDAEHATPLLLKDGKLDAPVSLCHFLEDLPFYCLYDDVECERPIELEEKTLHNPPVVAQEESLTTSLWNSIW